MRIALGNDHAGYPLKEYVRSVLEDLGHEVIDRGAPSEEPVDFPDITWDTCDIVRRGEADRAVLACGSGNGVAIAANKIHGIRAVNAHDADEAELARRHNDINVVTLSGSRLDTEQADAIVARLLQTGAEGGRHARRVDQIGDLERG